MARIGSARPSVSSPRSRSTAETAQAAAARPARLMIAARNTWVT
ncbi:MAG: hypothetical protein ABJB47_08260 [Actinomycetota bacterium]